MIKKDHEDVLSPSHVLTSTNSAKRQSLHHDKHIDLYPAHPGPRSPFVTGSRRSYEHQRSGSGERSPASKSPVFSRGASGDEVVRIVHHSRGDSGSGGYGESSESGGSSSGGMAVDPVGLSGLLQEARARRPNQVNAEHGHEHEHGDTEVSAAEEEDEHEHEEAELSTAQAIDLRHVGGG